MGEKKENTNLVFVSSVCFLLRPPLAISVSDLNYGSCRAGESNQTELLFVISPPTTADAAAAAAAATPRFSTAHFLSSQGGRKGCRDIFDPNYYFFSIEIYEAHIQSTMVKFQILCPPCRNIVIIYDNVTMRNGHLYNFCWVIPCRQICRVKYFAFTNSENFPTQWQNTDNDDEDAERRSERKQ